MVKSQGIEVCLAPFNDITQRYTEFPADPTEFPTRFPAEDAHEAYIEAVNGERFVIVVDLGEEFEAKGSARLRIECFLDGELVSKQVSSYALLSEGAPPESALKSR
jgi:hypothetical protein